MMMVRPVRLSDLDDLLRMAKSSAGGITSLPPDRRLLHEKIERSQFAFSRDALRPKGESYLFVLESDQVIGCCGIHSKTGGYEPLYSYRVADGILNLERIHDGPSEVSTLFLDQGQRKGGLGRLLSLSRFLFIALHQSRFEPRVDALLRGVSDQAGNPLFWQAVCSPFFQMPFAEADARRYADPRFIEELVPQHPLYIALLPAEVRAIIGKAHERTRPAQKLLEEEGFVYAERVDIFDAGPTLSCATNDLWTVRNRKEAKIAKIESPAGEPQILCNHRLDFRAGVAPISISEGQATIDAETAAALEVAVGDSVSYRPLHGGQ